MFCRVAGDRYQPRAHFREENVFSQVIRSITERLCYIRQDLYFKGALHMKSPLFSFYVHLELKKANVLSEVESVKSRSVKSRSVINRVSELSIYKKSTVINSNDLFQVRID